MKTVKIIGVPEHFNLPWHLAIEEGAFEERGINLEWTEVPEGTGRMCQLLDSKETDLAIILTEGIIKSITQGNNLVNNLDGAVEGLTTGSADYFMWERFTTKPLVDSGIFRHLGNCPTPWPCFVLVGTDTFLSENKNLIMHILEIINTYTTEFKQIPRIDSTLSNRYHQKLKDIQEWLEMTEWSQKQLPKATLKKVQETLQDLNLIDKVISPSEILM